MIYECTDCKYCANFHDGFRVFCLHPELESNSVCNYYPVGNKDACHCEGFVEGTEPARRFSWKQLTQAENYSKEKKYGEVTYQGIREWCLKHLKENSKGEKNQWTPS